MLLIKMQVTLISHEETKETALELTLVYLVAEKISSNLSLSTFPSANGQFDSSWWTNMTFSKTAYEEIKILDRPLKRT
jgi:hypothetical protein